MQLQRSARPYRLFLMGLLVFAAFVLARRQHGGEAHDEEEGKGVHHHTEGGCRGFVILPNGVAVLSSLSGAPAHSSAGTLRWTVVGHRGAPTVTMEYLQGALTHGSRANVTFALTIRQRGAFIDTAQVRVLARIPHHDLRMPGGHGPAHDPDVQGIVVQAVGQGRYTIPAIDFPVAGPWLFEVQVRQDAEMHKVYLAAYIDEE